MFTLPGVQGLNRDLKLTWDIYIPNILEKERHYWSIVRWFEKKKKSLNDLNGNSSFKVICRTRYRDGRTKRLLYASAFGEHNKMQIMRI